MSKMTNKAIAMNVRNSIDAQNLTPQEKWVARVSKAGASAVRGSLNSAQRDADEKTLNTAFARSYATSHAKAGETAEQRPLFAMKLRDPAQLEKVKTRAQNQANTHQRLADSMSDLENMSDMDVIDLIMTSIMNADLPASERRGWLEQLSWAMSK